MFLLLNYNVKAEEPTWYTDKPDNTKLYLYSSGIGNDISEAILDALNGIIVLDDNYSNNIHINFTNYTIENSSKYNNKQYVLIAVKRNELFNLQIDNLKIINDIIENKYKNLSNNDFKNKKEIKDIISLIEEAKEKILIIKTIDNFNDSKIIKKYNNILKKLNDIKLTLNIDIKNQELDILRDDLDNIILDYGIKNTKKSKNILVVDMEVKKNKIHNSFIVNNRIKMSILDENNKIIKYNYRNYETISDVSYLAAYETNMFEIKNNLKNIFNELVNI